MEESNTTTESKPLMLRTILKPEIYERLEDYAKSLATGRGHWDFGVAIERLLDWATIDERLIIIEERLTQLEIKNFGIDEPKTEVKTTLVGGHKLE